MLQRVANAFRALKGHPLAGKRSSPGFQAAAVNRLLNDLTDSTLSSDSELRKDLPKLRPRARQLVNDNDYAQKVLWLFWTNVLGENGINFRNKAKDPDEVRGGRLVPGKLDVFANKQVEEAWWEWSKRGNCTVTRQQTLFDVKRLVLSEAITVGGCLVRMVKGFDNPFRFALQLIEIECLDIDLNRPSHKGSNEIRMGIELNQWKEQVAFHVLKTHPYDNYFYPSQAGMKWQRIPASEVIHPFLPRRIGQIQGYPHMATAMSRMNMVGKYEEAEVTAARAHACIGGVIQTKGDAMYEGAKDDSGNTVMEMAPGLIPQLPAGLELKDFNPTHPSTQYAAAIKQFLRGVSAGLGFISYNSLGNDMESVNFASGKLGLEEERQGWKVIQRWFCDHFMDVLFEHWLEVAILSGQVKLPMSKFAKFNQPCWGPRRWGHIDPTAELGAIKTKLRLGLTTVSKELSKEDVDRDEHFQEHEEDRKAMARHKLEFPDLEGEKKEMGFKEQVYLGFQKDGTVGDVLANLADLSALSDEVGIPREKSAEAEPWLPVIADGGAVVTGDVVKDKEGDIVGGEADPVEDPNATTEPEQSAEMQQAEAVKALLDAYGVAVRAGTITPTEDDENFFRSKFGLSVPAKVGEAWKEDEGIRRPITLQPNAEQLEAQKPAPIPGQGKATPEGKTEKKESAE